MHSQFYSLSPFSILTQPPTQIVQKISISRKSRANSAFRHLAYISGCGAIGDSPDRCPSHQVTLLEKVTLSTVPITEMNTLFARWRHPPLCAREGEGRGRETYDDDKYHD